MNKKLDRGRLCDMKLNKDIVITNNEKGYAHDSEIGYSNPNWMGKMPGDTKISALSIPGTHNSMARFGDGTPYPDDYVITQTMNLITQLNSGSRYLDIRLRKDSNTQLSAYHGSANQRAIFGIDILDKITAFLRTNPGETVLMRVKNECNGPGTGKCTDASTIKTWAQVFEDSYYNNASYSNYFWKGTSNNPTLNEVKGKIVVLSDFPTDGKRFGIPYSSITRQDQFDVDNTPDAMYAKWTAVKQHLQVANANNGQAMYLNYLSGNGAWYFITRGAAPYFVASGYRGSGTNSSMQMITEHRTDKWPDYPRGVYGQVFYGGTNLLAVEFISKLGLRNVGIIAADFPGKGLIDRVIRLNDRHLSGDIRYITPKGSSGLRIGFGGDVYLRNHYVVYRNGNYIGEVVNGNPYYSYWDQTDVGHDLRFEGLPLFTGDKIDVYVKNGSNQTLLKSQTLAIDEQEGEEIRVADGPYIIKTALNNTSALDMTKTDRNVQLYSYQNQLNAEFVLKYDENKKAYRIINRWDPTRALGRDGASHNVFGMGLDVGRNEQYWKIKRALNGYVYLENLKNEQMLDVSYSDPSNNTNIIIWGWTANLNQKFKVVERKEKLEGQIDSLYNPQPGQKNRSSGNFSLGHLAEGTRVRVSIEGGGETVLNFRVMRDKTGDTDPTIWSDVKHGSIVGIPIGANKNNLYIANPSLSGAPSPGGTFKVKFYTLQN